MRKLLLALAPVALVVAFGLLWLHEGTRHSAWVLSDENQPIELVSFGAFFVAGLAGLWHLRALAREGVPGGTRALFGLISLGLLVVAMEEISWGQWFFRFETPEAIEWRNMQGELNLHNLAWGYGKSEVLRMTFAAGGLVGLAAGRAGWLRRIAPGPALLPWFLVIAANALVELLVAWAGLSLGEDLDRLVIHVMPEMTEMVIALAGLGYVLGVVRRADEPTA